MNVGICGYPGSGKTTVFSALAPGARPQKGVSLGSIKVPDDRVDRLAALFHPRKTTYAELVFVDVPGEVGRGVGAFHPQVVQAMRNSDLLVHVVRGFESPYHDTPPDPDRDVALFDDESVLLDLAILEKRAERWHKEAHKGLDVDVNERCVACLSEGRPLRTLDLDEGERATLSGIQLLSLKPLVLLHNLSEAAWENAASAPLRAVSRPAPRTVQMGICGALEAELAALSPEDQPEMLAGLGLAEPARNVFIRVAYDLLDLVSFLTCGEDECRAWPLRRGWNARRAAGRIHSDLERGFIRAEVYRLEDLEAAGSEAALRVQGKIRVEGKDYVVQDGDVLHVRFAV
ncbi:MAG: redox-regulated ATPase YchF [Deltaproteobacteria bacterium]|nr:redox-regulated ATPase YchF [Deltaproteobacteria bacterium]